MAQATKVTSKQRRKASKSTKASLGGKTNPRAQATKRHPGEQSQSRRPAAQRKHKQAPRSRHAAKLHAVPSAAKEPKLKLNGPLALKQETAAGPVLQDQPMVERAAQPGEPSVASSVKGLRLATDSIALGTAMWMRAALLWGRMGATAARQMWGATN